MLLEESDIKSLGYDVLDQDHRDFARLVNSVSEADNVSFPTLFQELLEHTESHFERENQLMADSAFPALAEHRGEHARVLGEMRQFQRRVNKGLVAFGRSYVRENLPGWFSLHVVTMDSALVAHLEKRTD